MSGLGQAPGLGEGYDGGGDGSHGVSGIRRGREWVGDERRPARWDQRWSWQNRGGIVDETAEQAEDPNEGALTEIDGERVVEALEAWILATHASQMGRTWGVSQPAGRRAYAEHLAAGPVAAVLEALGFAVIEDGSR